MPYGCSCKNLAPRFGWAYRLPKKWGTLRAAYGLQYGEIFPVTFQQVRYNPPLNLKFEVQAPDLLLPFSQLNIPVDPNARVTYLDVSPHLRTPYSHLYKLHVGAAGAAALEDSVGVRWQPIAPTAADVSMITGHSRCRASRSPRTRSMTGGPIRDTSTTGVPSMARMLTSMPLVRRW